MAQAPKAQATTVGGSALKLHHSQLTLASRCWSAGSSVERLESRKTEMSDLSLVSQTTTSVVYEKNTVEVPVVLRPVSDIKGRQSS